MQWHQSFSCTVWQVFVAGSPHCEFRSHLCAGTRLSRRAASSAQWWISKRLPTSLFTPLLSVYRLPVCDVFASTATRAKFYIACHCRILFSSVAYCSFCSSKRESSFVEKETRLDTQQFFYRSSSEHTWPCIQVGFHDPNPFDNDNNGNDVAQHLIVRDSHWVDENLGAQLYECRSNFFTVDGVCNRVRGTRHTKIGFSSKAIKY